MAGWRAFLAFICLVAGAAEAPAYPTRPITIIVPAAPGGVSDSLARAVGQRLSEVWNQQVIVENRGGANHQIGAAQVAKAPPDGHMLMLGAETIFVINPSLYSRLPYAVKDFAPVTGLVRANQALLAHAKLRAQERRRADRARQGEARHHQLRHVGRRLRRSRQCRAARKHGGREAPARALSRHGARTQRRRRRSHPADVGGRELGACSRGATDWSRCSGSEARSGCRASRRCRRWPRALPGYEATTWFGLFTTAGTPREVVLKINAEVQRLFNEEAFRKRFLEPLLYEVMTSSPDQFDDFIAAETKKWAKVIRDANLKVD